MTIPMVNLTRQYELIGDEIKQAVQQALDSGKYILGPNVTAFEQETAEYFGVKHSVGVASGTDALHLALVASGVTGGDEVITTPFTFIATAEAIAYTGATPVFVDVDAQTLNIDVNLIENAITERTKAVLIVHLYGQTVDMAPVKTLCEQRGIRLIEDCAHAFGAEYRGEKAGALGDFGCFSFYPSKNLGAFGDGGLITTNNDSFAETLRALRNHGSFKPAKHSIIGFNSRLDDIQAAILRVKFSYIDDFNKRRRQNAHHYNTKLAAVSGIETPVEKDHGLHVYHQYTIRVTQRDKVCSALEQAGIAYGIHYGTPLHRQPVFFDAYKDTVLPVVEQAANEVLCLPICPDISAEEIDTICSVLSGVNQAASA